MILIVLSKFLEKQQGYYVSPVFADILRAVTRDINVPQVSCLISSSLAGDIGGQSFEQQDIAVEASFNILFAYIAHQARSP